MTIKNITDRVIVGRVQDRARIVIIFINFFFFTIRIYPQNEKNRMETD